MRRCASLFQDAQRGLTAADLGGGVIKQRIARPGEGKSGGFRTLIVFRAEKDNVDKGELAAIKKLASELLALDDRTLGRVVRTGTLIEVMCDEKTIPKPSNGIDPRNRGRTP